MNGMKVKTVTLTLTQSCNLKCSYCYEHYKSPRKMSLDTAKEIIDREICNVDGIDAFEFDLFGGEPFLAFDLIKEITEYIRNKNCPLPYVVFATTNGTLVHAEIQEWLKSHSDCFVCGLSLDGTREMHNINRSNSYDDIDLEFFQKQYPDQDVKMTISQETLPSLAAGVIDMHKKGFLVSCNLAYEIDWSQEKNSDILSRELTKLIDFYLENPDIEPCSMLAMEISNIGMHSDKAVRFCGAGRYMCSYDVDGRAYPCQFFMPLSIGEGKAANVKNIAFPNEIIPDEYLDEKCKRCVIRSACPNCFGANYASTGNIYSREDNMCRLTKIIMKARSFFRAKQWELGHLHMDKQKEQALLRAIIKIQEELEVE